MDYDAVAHRYDRRYDGTDYEGIATALADFAGDDPTRRVLEIGCGTGHWLALLARRGFVDLAGLDVSSRMLDVAAAKVGRADLRQEAAEQPSWNDATFDRVFCVNALHHFRDRPQVVAQVRRLLRRGGGFLTVGLDPSVGTDRWPVYDYFDGALEADRRRYPPAATIRARLTAAGFTEVRTWEAARLRLQLPAREVLAAGYLDRGTTSQLTLLSDDAYREGMARLTRSADEAERRGETLVLRSDLHLYATVGWMRSGAGTADLPGDVCFTGRSRR